MHKIVVGLDGSEHSRAALAWALAEAEVHGADVEALLAWTFLDQPRPSPDAPFDPHFGEDAALATLASWVGDVPGSDAVSRRVVNDLPVPALLQAGDDADLVVLGARGTGGFEGLLLGSVSERVAQLAARPVAVVRSPEPVRGARVVVGIDGSARSIDALRWAAGEARARDAELDVVHTWRTPMITPTFIGTPIADLGLMEDAGREILEGAVADPALEGVRVTPYLGTGSPARALLERTEGAGLVVVGTRGRGRVGSALLGSVSRQVLHHAPCPVVTI